MELSKKSTTRKYIVNSNTFLLEDDISFYLLGAYMTDGHINDTIHHRYFSIASKDGDWLESIKNIICPNKPVYKKKRDGSFSFETSELSSINWLISYGCKAKKSKTLTIEKPIPQQYHRDFIRGVLDGDGSISISPYKKEKNGKEYHYIKTVSYICSASKVFLEQVKEMIPKEINCTLHMVKQKDSIINGALVKATCDMYRLTFNDSNAKKLLIWLYYSGHKISLERKAKIALTIKNA